MPGKCECDCSFAENQLLFLSFGPCCFGSFVPLWLWVPGTAAPPQLSHLGGAGARASHVPVRWGSIHGGLRVSPWDGGEGSLGRALGDPSAATVLRGRAGRASSPAVANAVANAWHSSCISVSVPRERGNQKYLSQREAQRASGTYPAPSDKAAPRLWPEKPRVTGAGLGYARRSGVSDGAVGVFAGGNVPVRGLGRSIGCSPVGGFTLTAALTQKPKLFHKYVAY